jgi:proline iminopeptidase
VNCGTADRLTALLIAQVPTLVTVGRYDYVTPLHFSEEMDREIPDSQLVIFEHSGHSPQVEETDKFREVVQDFLQARVL